MSMKTCFDSAWRFLPKPSRNCREIHQHTQQPLLRVLCYGLLGEGVKDKTDIEVRVPRNTLLRLRVDSETWTALC